ncbi:LLM class flavin-dependent oxidoreductase [Synoicihabitans lomoniglobus]|uniref:Luciferase-like monooxygenase n=1 Tax=Synoicihabitans lomoniglobus TaxID=2909285 RepID=A0AAF0CNI0_9BACT|nr:LLM class flavin-dependent oxidoreductase [Opitutaceae bacterium LMO-M01]WED64445.1 LLM class flavin-dependent oxidoreductase [Opitutaceae bacterium LMO-M01]
MASVASLPLSVLDLAPIVEGGDAADAFRRSRELVQATEKLGYRRYWVAEHHSIPGVASAATAVLIGHLAAVTSRIRVGAGGIMLPNHSPLVIAEQFGTLEAMFPGRIDLGLGRAPGSDQATAMALRQERFRQENNFERLLAELQRYLGDATPGQPVQAVPGQGSHVPLWLLSSSGYSAELAGRMGLPFSFASQFAPAAMMPALAAYREVFTPSGALSQPHAMVTINVVAGESDAEAYHLATSSQQSFLNLIRGEPGKLPPPVESMDALWSAPEREAVDRMLSASIIGGPDTVKRKLEALVARTAADEIMINAAIFDQAARLRSYAIIAEVTGLTAN